MDNAQNAYLQSRERQPPEPKTKAEPVEYFRVMIKKGKNETTMLRIYMKTTYDKTLEG